MLLAGRRVSELPTGTNSVTESVYIQRLVFENENVCSVPLGNDLAGLEPRGNIRVQICADQIIFRHFARVHESRGESS